MLEKIRSLFEKLTEPVSEQSGDGPIQLAAAVLLVEAMMADDLIDESEIRSLIKSLQGLFQLTQEQSHDLLQLAKHRHDTLVSLHDMTHILNAAKDQDLKKNIIFAMWRIALVDENKDKYEEHLIRKVADLLYVSHTDFIQARLKAETEYT